MEMKLKLAGFEDSTPKLAGHSLALQFPPASSFTGYEDNE